MTAPKKREKGDKWEKKKAARRDAAISAKKEKQLENGSHTVSNEGEYDTLI